MLHKPAKGTPDYQIPLNENFATLEDKLQYKAHCTHDPDTNLYTLSLQNIPESAAALLPAGLPDLFTVVARMPTEYTDGGKVKIGEVEYTLAYTDDTGSVSAGAWKSGAVVTLEMDNVEKKAFVGSSLTLDFQKKSNLTQVVKSMGNNPTNYMLNQVARIIASNPLFPSIYGTYICQRSAIDGNGGGYALHIFATGTRFWWQQTVDNQPIVLANWKEVASVGTPLVSPIPFINNLRPKTTYEPSGEDANIYWKNSSNEVTIIASCIKGGTSDDIPNGIVMFTLPTDCRPKRTIMKRLDVISNSPINPLFGWAFIRPSGAVQVFYNHGVPVRSIELHVTFPVEV